MRSLDNCFSFGKESPITSNWGKVLEYLGMTTDYRRSGKVKISMYGYILMLNELPPDMEGTAKTLAKNVQHRSLCKQKLNTKSSR